MSKSLGLTGAAIVALFVAGWGVASRGQQDPVPSEGPAAKAGEKLDELGRAIKRSIIDAEDTVREGLNKSGDTVRDGFARTRDSVQAMGLAPRVYGRLHWDKALHSSQLMVKAEGGTVTIRGTVPDDAAKAKVTSLAKDTFGVTRVVLQIHVMSPNSETTHSEAVRQPRTPAEPAKSTTPKTTLEQN